MAATVPVQAPWTAANAVSWDSQTLETWKQNNRQRASAVRRRDRGRVRGRVPRHLAAVYALLHGLGDERDDRPLTSTGLFSTAGGAQDSRLVGGSQLISIRMAEQLDGRVLLEQPVREIVQTRGRRARPSDSLTVSAKHVIVTGPPSITALIRYEPVLPFLRAQLTQRYPQGTVIKCEAVYDKPFWRDAGLTGQAVSLTGPVKVTFDNSPPDGSPGVLLGFIEGQAARRAGLLSPAARKAAVLQNFVTYFGEQAGSPREFIEMNWSAEEWTRGCYVGFTAPGVLLDTGRRSAPRSGGSIGRAPRPPTIGTATWTARCARGCGPHQVLAELEGARAARRHGGGGSRSSLGAERKQQYVLDQ